MAGQGELREIVERTPIGKGLDDFLHIFQTICHRANVPPTPDALDRLGKNLVQDVILAFVSAVQRLPAAGCLTTVLRGELIHLHLELQLHTNRLAFGHRMPFDFESIKLPLKTALAGIPDEVVFWNQVYKALEPTPKNSTITEYASNEHGRGYFMRALRMIERNYDSGTWTRMTNDLFHKVNYPSFNIRALLFTFLKDQTPHLQKYCIKWAIPVCNTLNQLTREIYFAIELFQFQEWDDAILKDALEAVRYSIYDFLGPILRVLQLHCQNIEPSTEAGVVNSSRPLETFGEVADYCRECRVAVEIAFGALLFHLSHGQAKRDGIPPSNEDKLKQAESFNILKLQTHPAVNEAPTATFTELVVQNQAIALRRSIVTTLDAVDLNPATGYISKILSKQNKLRSKYPIAPKAGIPLCLAVVVDRQTGIITTGATQPAYDEQFPWLYNVGKQIHGLRIGEIFSQAIHLCSENVAKLAEEARATAGRSTEDMDEKSVETIYKNYMSATTVAADLAVFSSAAPDLLPEAKDEGWYSRLMHPERYGYEVIPKPKEDIFSWAFDTHFSETTHFRLKPPCLRCQRIYSAWILHGAPENTGDRRTALRDIYHKTIAYNKKQDKCAYCAETAAAAKMYLVHSGRLCLG